MGPINFYEGLDQTLKLITVSYLNFNLGQTNNNSRVQCVATENLKNSP